jgi:general secretion pathway protein E/type IV pilus assembly protein PilB
MARPSVTDELDAVQVLDHLVRRAVASGASDIHIEPRRDAIRVRYRIDGVMVGQGQLPVDIGPSLVSRIKVLGRMDMTERRLPQDGQFTLEMGGPSPVHLRASTFPAIHGETVVLRVLLGHQLIPIEELGMAATDVGRVKRLVDRPSGLIVVCGPTGAGKTSTLYSLLRVVNTGLLSVVTLEDPIEVELPEVTQGQTNVRQGFTFAAGLRAILRQDPDVILVGEMRDPETAQIALQASLTGHLVLSTLHTSNAIETIVRLVDLGVEPWIIANSLLAVIGQRLVRLLCLDCAEPYEQEGELRDEAGEVLIEQGTPLCRTKGCEKCHQTGYRGRSGIFEVLEISDELRELIKFRSSKQAYRQATERTGMTTIRQAGVLRARARLTTMEEVLRVT